MNMKLHTCARVHVHAHTCIHIFYLYLCLKNVLSVKTFRCVRVYSCTRTCLYRGYRKYLFIYLFIYLFVLCTHCSCTAVPVVHVYMLVCMFKFKCKRYTLHITCGTCKSCTCIYVCVTHTYYTYAHVPGNTAV